MHASMLELIGDTPPLPTIVTLIIDTGIKYLSTDVHEIEKLGGRRQNA